MKRQLVLPTTLLLLATVGLLSFGWQTIHTAVWNGFLEELLTARKHFNEIAPEDRVYLHADKPLYQPGETVWFTVYVRNGASLRASQQSDIVRVELINPKGNVERTLQLIAKNGVAEGDFDLASNAVGGVYKLKTYTNWLLNDPQPAFFEKEIQVQQVVLPRLKMKLDFTRKAYGAGDEVNAELLLEDNANQPLANFGFEFVVNLDGQTFISRKGTTGKAGEALVSFTLPQKLSTNDGLLNVMISYQGQTESISRAVPIVLNNIQLGLYPEGGDLVAGLPAKVAFKAVNEFGKPADVEGVLQDEKGNEITRFSAFHDGMGAFEFTPAANTHYRVALTKPQGIVTQFDLPDALPRGYVLNVREVTAEHAFITIHSTEAEEIGIIATVRGETHFATRLTVNVGENKLSIPLKDFPMGVAQLTLFDAKGIERAERLMMVNSHKQLNISVKTNKEQYLPREKVTLTVQMTDERGMPMPGNLSLAVTDDQLLAFADDKSSNILSWLLMEADIKEKVAEPNFYFDPTKPKAPQALDYVLMTSGWRRFSWEAVRYRQIPPPAYTNERTVIAGKVLDASHRWSPVADAVVKIGNRTTRTDKDGYYRFEGVELYEAQTLKATSPKHNEGQLPVYAYSDDLNITLYSKVADVASALRDEMVRPTGVVKNIAKRAVPQKALMAADIVEQAVEEAELFDDAMVMPAEPLPVPSPPAVEDKEQDADRAAEPDVVFAEVVVREDLNMGDDDFNGNLAKEKALKPAHAQPQAIPYYRARQFAAPLYPDNAAQPDTRSDFRSTVYWNGNVKLDRTGKATLHFYNNDAVTSFRIIAEGIAADGMVGRTEAQYFTQLPFSLSAKLPVEAVVFDELLLPVTLVNNTAQSLTGNFELMIVGGGIQPIDQLPPSLTLTAGQAITKYIKCKVVAPSEAGKIRLVFRSKGFADEVEQPLVVRPKGFPVLASFGGNQLEQQFKLNMHHPVKGSIAAQLTAHPSSVSEMVSGLEGMLREPYGCFEQTSSSTYPNILVLNYLEETKQVNPAIAARARDLIKRGYSALVGFESKSGGFEWFGGDPAHEGLTAYGLMEFIDMKKVYDGVDEAMLDRTTRWLLGRRDGKGGFQRNPYALHEFGLTDEATMSMYITWALTEAGFTDLAKEVNFAYQTALQTGNVYQLGLAANILYHLKDAKRGDELLRLLIAKQTEAKAWLPTAPNFRSAPGSGGVSLGIETASLALMAMLKTASPDVAQLRECATFIQSQRGGYGGFGTTNSTVLALRALVAYAKYNKRTDSDGAIEVYVNGKKVMEKGYTKGEQNAIVLDGLEAFLGEGEQVIKVKYVGTSTALPYSVGVSYYTSMPAADPACQVQLKPTLAATTAKVGETVRLTAQLRNTANQGQPMTMAILGIPAGLSPQPWQLKALLEQQKVDFYEIAGNQLILYYRQMRPLEEKTIQLDLKADLAGTFEAPASRAYLYYTAEHKHWVKLPAITIKS